MWQSISMCFVRSWNTGFAVICNVAWLSQKSWAGKLNGTFKSYNRYHNQTISKQVLVIARYFASANDLDTFVCFFLLPWDNRRTKKNAIPKYWSPSCLTTSPVWIAISCQCQIVFWWQYQSLSWWSFDVL